MALGNKIVVKSHDNRPYLEGIIDGTDKPGTVMQIKAATEPISGRFTWENYDRGADGERPQGPLAILAENWKLGKDAETAYVDGEYCFLWVPQAGEELNVLVANIGGTSDSFAIGDLLIVDDGTGKMIATTGSPESEPFMVAETVAALTADALVHVFATGY